MEILLEKEEIDDFNDFFNKLRQNITTNKTFFETLALLKLANTNLYNVFEEELESKIKQNEDLKFMTNSVYFANTDLTTDELNAYENATRLAGGDILKLYRMCSNLKDGEINPIYVQLLRKTELLRGLVNLVYAENHPKSLIKEKIYLLGLAGFYDGK